MNVGFLTGIALCGLILIGCTGAGIAPADSAATAPGIVEDPVAALYAAPADVAFITVGDIRADIVGPDELPFTTGYGFYTAELVTAHPPLEELALALTPAEAVAPPFNVVDVDLDAFFSAAVPAAGVAAPVVWERAPQMQRVDPAIITPPLDAK